MISIKINNSVILQIGLGDNVSDVNAFAAPTSCVRCLNPCVSLLQAITFPFPINNLLSKRLWQCKAWRSMAKNKSSNGWSQQWLTTQPTSWPWKGAIASVGQIGSNWSCVCELTDGLGIRATSVHAQFSHNNLTVFDAKTWMTLPPPSIHGAPREVFPWNSWGK